MKVRTWHDPLYGIRYNLYLLCTDNEKEMSKVFNLVGLPEDYGTVHALTHYNDGICSFILDRGSLDTPREIMATVVHESVHAGQFVLASHGCEMSDATKEPYAYYIQYVFSSLIDKLISKK